MPIIVYVHIHLEIGYFKARGVKKDSIPNIIKFKCTHIPVKNGIVYPDVDCLLYGPGYMMSLHCSLQFTPVDPALNIIKDLLEKDDTLWDRSVLSVQNITELLGFCLQKT